MVLVLELIEAFAKNLVVLSRESLLPFYELAIPYSPPVKRAHEVFPLDCSGVDLVGGF